MINANIDGLFGALEKAFPGMYHKDKQGRIYYEVFQRRKNGQAQAIKKVFPDFSANNGMGVVDNIKNDMVAAVKKELANAGNKMMVAFKNSADTKKMMQEMSLNIKNLTANMNVVKNLGWLNAGLSVANIGVSVAGFAMMNAKMNELSNQIASIDKKVDSIFVHVQAIRNQQTSEVEEKYNHFTREIAVLIEDVQKGNPIDRKSFCELIDQVNGFINQQYGNFMREPNEVDLKYIYTLTPLMSDLIVVYYELFFYEQGAYNQARHDNWISTFDKLASDKHIELLTDFYFIDAERPMHLAQVNDMLLANYMITCDAEMKVQEIVDFLKESGSKEEYQNVINMMDEIIKTEAREEFDRVKDELNYSEDVWNDLEKRVWSKVA